METRTAPQWIREAQKLYERKRRLWVCADVLWWVGWLALLCTTRWSVARLICAAAWVGLRIREPHQRATLYGAAACTLNGAIAHYVVDPGQPESMLDDAGRGARESLRLERIRLAPAWIRGRRRQYRMKVVRWFLPVLVSLALPAAAILVGYRLERPWHRFSAVAAPFLLLVVATVRTRKLTRALGMLGQAIDRYEFESAATLSDLDEAGWRATVVVLGRNARRELAQ